MNLIVKKEQRNLDFSFLNGPHNGHRPVSSNLSVRALIAACNERQK